MDIIGSGIVAFLLVAGAGYWLVKIFFPQVKKDVIDGKRLPLI